MERRATARRRHRLRQHAPSTSEEWATLANNAALFATHRATVSHIGGVQPGGIWQRRDLAFAGGGRAAQLGRLAEQVALHHGLAVGDLPPELGDELGHVLDALPVGPTQSRRPRGTPNRLRPDMRMIELFEDWRAGNQPSAQTAIEFQASVTDFVDYLGDIPVAQITSDDILDYRDRAKELPAAMPKADRLLSFMARIAKHGPDKGSDSPRPPRISPATLQKRVGAIQAMLTYAKKQRWIATNVGRDLAILSSRSSSAKRRSLEEEQLVQLFSQPLFRDRSCWSWTHRTSDCSLYWLFLICCTTGARIEEIGQALLTDVKRRSGVTYIDVDRYVEDIEIDPADADQGEKSVKNDNSCRLIPVHDRLLELGFSDYCDALRATGQIRVFPDLLPNKLGKRTQDASKRANAFIDQTISKDRRLVFHSFRHGFNDRATEAGLSARVVMQICGHAATTVNDKYGSGVRLPALYGFLHQLAWPEIGWDELLKSTSGTDWNEIAARYARRGGRMTPGLDIDRVFEHHLRRRDAELQETTDKLTSLMRMGSDSIRKRMKNPTGSTTPVAVREAALKKHILANMEKLAKVAGEMSKLMVSLHMDETELALVIEARNQSAVEYWKRLADGRVYAGARAMLDQLHQHHGIDATKLAGLSQHEVEQIGRLITDLTRRRDAPPNVKAVSRA